MIKKAHELGGGKFKMLIGGARGAGKTTLALSAPRPLLIDADFGLSRVAAAHRRDYILPVDYDELLYDLRPGNLHDYDTLVFDTGCGLLELLGDYSLANNGPPPEIIFEDLLYRAHYRLGKNIIVTEGCGLQGFADGHIRFSGGGRVLELCGECYKLPELEPGAPNDFLARLFAAQKSLQCVL